MKLLNICLLVALMPFSSLYALKRPPGFRHQKHAAPRVQYGLASWYGAKEQGHIMACGKPFDEYELIAAHRTLPLGTRVRVTNLRNGRSVIVRIEDRGPAVAGRVIDLSWAAARLLRFTGWGLAPVKLRVLTTPRKTGDSVQALGINGGREAPLHNRRTRRTAS